MKPIAKNDEFSKAHAAVKSVLAQNLKFCRKHANFSQEELGHRIGADQAYISRIETGLLNPTIETLSELANVLEIDVERLFKQ